MTVKIIMVDDEPELEGMIKLRMRRQIREGEYRFFFARNGIEALLLLEDHPDVEVVVLDINMPEMDGHTLLKKIGEKYPLMKCIVVSAYGDMTNIRTAMNNGAFDYIVKPLNIKDFEITLEKTIRISKELKESRLMEAEAKKKTLEALEKEKHLNKLKDQFISLISREYRNPLAVIQTSSDIVRSAFNGSAAPEQIKSLENINKSVTQMTKLLDDVMLIGELKNGRSKTYFSDINLQVTCESVISDIRSLDKNRHDINFISNVNIEKIKSDEGLFSQILNNLLLNAANYSPENTQIKVALDKIHDFVQLKVEDSGCGIPENELENIFDPFYRADNVRTYYGTGLGLSIVKECVEILNGTIDVESKSGKGTVFTIRLPVSIN